MCMEAGGAGPSSIAYMRKYLHARSFQRLNCIILDMLRFSGSHMRCWVVVARVVQLRELRDIDVKTPLTAVVIYGDGFLPCNFTEWD